MRIRNVQGIARAIAATGEVVPPGETAEVGDELGASLLEQTDVWASVKTKTSENPPADTSEENS